LIKIPVYKPSLVGNEKKYVNQCLDTNWISSKGEFVQKFECAFSNYVGVNHATAVCNGTCALHLALLALGVGKGDEVIVPTLTYIASANAITYTGATPVFVDSLPTTWQMNPQEIKQKISPRTKAILVVHLYGHPCAMNEITKIARQHNLSIVEDCAEALGSRYKNQNVGTFGDIAMFSFYGNKTITTGEGGMVITNDETLADKVKKLKGQGLAKNGEYWHDTIGYNYRMTNICAAIGLAQLERIESILEQKQKVANLYKKFLADSSVTIHETNRDIFHSYWMVSILTQNKQEKESTRKALSQNGVETRPLFHPIHTMPIYKKEGERLPVAQDLSTRGINLPSWPGLTKKEIEFICEKIKLFISSAAEDTHEVSPTQFY